MSDFSSADWSRAKVVQSTDQRNDVMVAQYVSSFSCARFPEKTRRKWTPNTVNVIVKKKNKQIDNNLPWSVLLSTIKMMSRNVQNFAVQLFLRSIRVQIMENCY